MTAGYNSGGNTFDGGAGIPIIPIGAPLVGNVTALRAQPPTVSVVCTLGYATTGDGGAGVWHWDDADTSTDDGGTVVQVAGIPTGRWNRIGFDGSFNSSWWGSIGNGSADDTPAIALAVAARRLRGAGNIFLPLPPVAYMMQPQTYVYGPRFPSSSACVDIDFSNVTIYGDPGTEIRARTFGGGNPDTDFKLIWRNALDSFYPFGSPTTPPSWAAGVTYAPGAVILGPNGHFYLTFAGGTSGAGPGPNSTDPTIAGNLSDGAVFWALYDYTWRCNFFRIKSAAVNPVLGPGNITFQDIIFNGQAPYRADLYGPISSLPAPAPTAAAYDRPALVFGGTLPGGQGWAPGHTPVVLAVPYNYGPITFTRCGFKNWRSENIYASYGSALCGKITIEGCTFDNATGDALSTTSGLLVEDCTFTNCTQAVECDPAGFDATFRRNHIADCAFGLTIPSSGAFYAGRGRTLIEDCLIERCGATGLLISGYTTNVKVKDTVVKDCNQIGGPASVWVFDQYGGVPTNIEFDGVEVISDTRDVLLGISVAALTSATSGSSIHHCKFTRTAAAIANSHSLGHSIQVSAAAGSDWDVHDNDCRGATYAPQGYGPSPYFFLLPVRFQRNRAEGMTFEALVAPYLDPRGFDDFSVLPGGAANFSTARGFALGVQTRIVINGNATITASASIVLASGSSWAPGGSGGETAFVRPVAGSDKVYEVPGRRIAY